MNYELENYNRLIKQGMLVNDSEKLKQIWDFCDQEQKRLFLLEEECSVTDYNQGQILAFRKIQYEINKKCTDLLNIKG